MFKKLVTCNNAIEAELLKGALEDMDIPCIIQGEVTSLMYGGIGALPVVLLVDDKDIQRAKSFLTEEEKARVKGLIINKFRGDKTILDPGITMLEERGGVPVAGVVPYMQVALEDEDSLTERFGQKQDGIIDIAVIRYPRISNFTDFNVFEQMPEVTVRYVTSVAELHHPDMICLPGSKNTMGDLK